MISRIDHCHAETTAIDTRHQTQTSFVAFIFDPLSRRSCRHSAWPWEAAHIRADHPFWIRQKTAKTICKITISCIHQKVIAQSCYVMYICRHVFVGTGPQKNANAVSMTFLSSLNQRCQSTLRTGVTNVNKLTLLEKCMCAKQEGRMMTIETRCGAFELWKSLTVQR